MIFKILLSLSLSTSLFAFDKDFKTVNGMIPLEFNTLFNSLKSRVKSPADKIRLVGIINELNNNLGNLEKHHVLFLMKSEVIKNVLTHRFPKLRSFDITTSLIERLEEKLKKTNEELHPFARWIWRSVIAELNHRKSKGLITSKTFKAANFTGAKKAEALRFQRYLNYLLPWIDQMDSLSPSEFNLLADDVSWKTLRRLNERSLLFKRFASSAENDTKVTIFNIPQKLLDLHPEEIKRIQDDKLPSTLKEEAARARSEARNQVEKASPDDMSPLSNEVTKELEKKAP